MQNQSYNVSFIPLGINIDFIFSKSFSSRLFNHIFIPSFDVPKISYTIIYSLTKLFL